MKEKSLQFIINLEKLIRGIFRENHKFDKIPQRVQDQIQHIFKNYLI